MKGHSLFAVYLFMMIYWLIFFYVLPIFLQEQLRLQDFSNFQQLNKRLLDDVDTMLSQDINAMMAMATKVPEEKVEPVPGEEINSTSEVTAWEVTIKILSHDRLDA